jgi:hypothetical protein
MIHTLRVVKKEKGRPMSQFAPRSILCPIDLGSASPAVLRWAGLFAETEDDRRIEPSPARRNPHALISCNKSRRFAFVPME